MLVMGLIGLIINCKLLQRALPNLISRILVNIPPLPHLCDATEFINIETSYANLDHLELLL